MSQADSARRCVVVGASPEAVLPAGFADVAAGAFLVAADGGYARCHEAGVACDLLVADYDSLAPGSVGEDAAAVVELPQAKDDTDLLAACKEGLARGCTEFLIYGCLGGDVGHSVAAVQVLAYLAQRGVRGWLVGGSASASLSSGASRPDTSPSGTSSLDASPVGAPQLVYLVRPEDGLDAVQAVGEGGRLAPAAPGTRVGVFSFIAKAEGVVERGLVWELDDAVLEAGFPLGASNEVRTTDAVLGVRDGLLLVVSGG